MKADRTEIQLACELIRVLDGLPIERARDALIRAQNLLLKTQTVSATNSLLAVEDENDAALNR